MRMFSASLPPTNYSDSDSGYETENERLKNQVAKLLRHTGNLENKILALKGDKEMKFEIGKKYKARGKDIKYIRVDAIRPEFLNSNYAMPITIFWKEVGKDPNTANIRLSGKCSEHSSADFDIIGPYEEPALLITAEDVGRKVKLKDGSIHIICGFIFAGCESDTSYRFVINGCCYNASGASLMTFLSTDVVDFV